MKNHKHKLGPLRNDNSETQPYSEQQGPEIQQELPQQAQGDPQETPRQEPPPEENATLTSDSSHQEADQAQPPQQVPAEHQDPQPQSEPAAMPSIPTTLEQRSRESMARNALRPFNASG